MDSFYDDLVRKPKKIIGMKHRIPEGGGFKSRLMGVYLLFELCCAMFYYLRLDYLTKPGYFKKHWKYCVFFLGLPIASSVFSMSYDWRTVPFDIVLFLLFGSFVYYFVGNTLFFRLSLNEILWSKFGKSKTIQIYEMYLVTMWMGVQVGFHSFIQATVGLGPSILEAVGSVLLCQVVGVVISVMGYISKGWATWLIGIDNYFFRDQLIAQPNPYLVQSKLFKYLNHPSYSVGYIVGYGYAISADSIWGLPAALLFHVGIIAFLKFAEEPGMRKLYGNAPEEKVQNSLV